MARAVRCLSAASTPAGGRSRPARVAVPDGWLEASTRASFSASSLRRFAASGSAAITARRTAGRSCPVVCAAAFSMINASTAAACSSSSAASSSVITVARHSSISPAASAARVSGSRSRPSARANTHPAPCWVKVSAAAISSSVCSNARQSPLARPSALRRAASPDTAASSPAAAWAPSRCHACITPVSSSSSRPPKPSCHKRSASVASTGPGGIVSAAPPCPNPAPAAATTESLPRTGPGGSADRGSLSPGSVSSR
jgi:hypothetical protein